jgi:glycosyltransferase involved in cell wall biosynthesis
VIKRALLVSTANPYPVVKDGCQRLVRDYVDAMFPHHDVHFLHVTGDTWSPLELFRDGHPVEGEVDVERLRDEAFEFLVFVGFKVTDFTQRLTGGWPSFCYTDTFPHPDVPAGVFRGILSHRGSSDAGDEEILLVGGSFDDTVFYPDRMPEDIVLSVGRIHPDKAQLQLVSRYRELIYEPFGLPLYLAGGAQDERYHRAIAPYVDGVAVISSVADPADPRGDASWHTGPELAELCNRARLFVSASPKESFSMAMIEAMACGTTCVVNGDYWGFAEADLRPHVHGNITGRRGSVLELAAAALHDDVRIDASQWAAKYALRAMRESVSQFVHARV